MMLALQSYTVRTRHPYIHDTRVSQPQATNKTFESFKGLQKKSLAPHFFSFQILIQILILVWQLEY